MLARAVLPLRTLGTICPHACLLASGVIGSPGLPLAFAHLVPGSDSVITWSFPACPHVSSTLIRIPVVGLRPIPIRSDFILIRWHLQRPYRGFGFQPLLGPSLLFFSCAGSSLPRGLFSCCGKWGLLSSCSVRASQCSGFSDCGPQALEHEGFSSRGTWTLERRLNSCAAWTSLLHSMSDLPRPRTKPVSPALAGRFFPSELPGKPSTHLMNGQFNPQLGKHLFQFTKNLKGI